MKRRTQRLTLWVPLVGSVAVTALTIGHWGPMIVEEWYIARVQSNDPVTRRHAALRLGQLRSVKALPYLIRNVVEGDNPIGDVEADDPIGDMEWKYIICEEAKAAVVGMGSEAVPSLLIKTESTDRFERIGALLCLKSSTHATKGVCDHLEKSLERAEEEEKEIIRWVRTSIGCSTVSTKL